MSNQHKTILDIICQEIIKKSKEHFNTLAYTESSLCISLRNTHTRKTNNYQIKIIENKIIVRRFSIGRTYINQRISQEHLSDPNSMEKTTQTIIENNARNH